LFKVSLSFLALKELEDAHDWYESKEVNLGLRFLDEFEETLTVIKHMPHFAVRYDKVRCIPVKKFPYLIHYQLFPRKKLILVVAVFHTSRKPKK